MTDEFKEIGHVMLKCPRCQQPRHVPVEAVCRPFAGPDTKTWKAMLNGRQVGEVHVAMRHGADDHRCAGVPTPLGTLNLIKDQSGGVS